jgi:hypothetical protein
MATKQSIGAATLDRFASLAMTVLVGLLGLEVVRGKI